MTTEVRGGALVIGADRSFSTVTPMTVEVTVPALDGATLAGSGQMTVDGVARCALHGHVCPAAACCVRPARSTGSTPSSPAPAS